MGETVTVLTGHAPSLTFSEDKSFIDVEITMTVEHGMYVSMEFSGLLMVVAEKNKVLAIKSTFDFSKP